MKDIVYEFAKTYPLAEGSAPTEIKLSTQTAWRIETQSGYIVYISAEDIKYELMDRIAELSAQKWIERHGIKDEEYAFINLGRLLRHFEGVNYEFLVYPSQIVNDAINGITRTAEMVDPEEILKDTFSSDLSYYEEDEGVEVFEFSFEKSIQENGIVLP